MGRSTKWDIPWYKIMSEAKYICFFLQLLYFWAKTKCCLKILTTSFECGPIPSPSFPNFTKHNHFKLYSFHYSHVLFHTPWFEVEKKRKYLWSLWGYHNFPCGLKNILLYYKSIQKYVRWYSGLTLSCSTC